MKNKCKVEMKLNKEKWSWTKRKNLMEEKSQKNEKQM
jgi:hypothetical protein